MLARQRFDVSVRGPWDGMVVTVTWLDIVAEAVKLTNGMGQEDLLPENTTLLTPLCQGPAEETPAVVWVLLLFLFVCLFVVVVCCLLMLLSPHADLPPSPIGHPSHPLGRPIVTK